MANNNIGHIKCPLSGQLSVVRADKRQKLYYFSLYGKITPNLPEGQRWLSENAQLWPDAIQPENIELRSLYNGAPPVVTITQSSVSEKPLTPQGEQKQVEKPLTDESVTPVKKKSPLATLLSGWGEDDD